MRYSVLWCALLLACGSGTPAPSTPAQAHGAFRFDWSPPCRVPVLEYSEKKGNRTRARYFLALDKDKTGKLQLKFEDYVFIELNGKDITGPKFQAELREMTALAGAIPR